MLFPRFGDAEHRARRAAEVGVEQRLERAERAVAAVVGDDQVHPLEAVAARFAQAPQAIAVAREVVALVRALEPEGREPVPVGRPLPGDARRGVDERDLEAQPAVRVELRGRMLGRFAGRIEGRVDQPALATERRGVAGGAWFGHSISAASARPAVGRARGARQTASSRK